MRNYSYSLLDGIIDSMENGNSGGASIVGQNHDMNSINWIAGMTDPGEMIACAYLPELRRISGEADVEYAARITPLIMALPAHEREKIMGAGKKAAIGRASLDTSNGRVNVMTAGQLPWHGLGVNVAQAVNSADAARLSGLAGWKIGKQQLFYVDATGTKREATDAYGIVRADTGSILGTVGSRYKPIQNEDGFAFLDGVLQQFGARYETAGSLYGGKKVWMLAHLPKQGFTINGGDRQEAYALFENCHDGSGAAACYPTSVRVVCNNTLRMAGHDKGKGMSIRHTGDVKDKIRAAQAALNLSVDNFEQYKEQAEAMYAAPLEIKHYANDVLDAVLDVTQAQADMGAGLLAATIAKTQAQQDLIAKSLEKRVERRGEILADILDRYESERCGIGSIRGTAWSAFNAVTEHADHAKIGRQASDNMTRLSRRFESSISGDADEMKQAALTIALTAIA